MEVLAQADLAAGLVVEGEVERNLFVDALVEADAVERGRQRRLGVAEGTDRQDAKNAQEVESSPPPLEFAAGIGFARIDQAVRAQSGGAVRAGNLFSSIFIARSMGMWTKPSSVVGP